MIFPFLATHEVQRLLTLRLTRKSSSRSLAVGRKSVLLRLRRNLKTASPLWACRTSGTMMMLRSRFTRSVRATNSCVMTSCAKSCE